MLNFALIQASVSLDPIPLPTPLHHLGVVHLLESEPLEVHGELLPNLKELLDRLGPGVVGVGLDGEAEALLAVDIHLT